MDRICLVLFFLSVGLTLSTCLLHQYHFVDQLLTWTEAQTYCRQTHTDLATIENFEDMTQVLDSLSSAGLDSEVWIGLYSDIDWRWSDGFNGTGADYRNWSTNNYEPNFYAGDQLCTVMGYTGQWWDISCSDSCPFFCYNGSQLDPKFFLVTKSMTWSSAQRFCRENFIDLATVRNATENQMVFSLRSTIESPLIGLFRDPNLYWSDGSSFLFSNWDDSGNPIGSMRIMCGVTSLQRSGTWRVLSCERRLPFVCYDLPLTQQVVKLKLQTEDSVDLNDPVLKENILKELQDKLKENRMTDVTLEWREQPDGEDSEGEEKGRRLI